MTLIPAPTADVSTEMESLTLASMATLSPACTSIVLRGVEPPTTPENTALPGVVTDRAYAPSIWLPKPMSPADDLNDVSEPRDTASFQACAPVVVISPPLMTDAPGASVVMPRRRARPRRSL